MSDADDVSINKAAGGVLTAKQAPHRPGTAPAPGLRAWEMCAHYTADHFLKGDIHAVPYSVERPASRRPPHAGPSDASPAAGALPARSRNTRRPVGAGNILRQRRVD